MRHRYVSDEIADHRDFLDTGIRKFDAGKFILDQYHQLELIEPVEDSSRKLRLRIAAASAFRCLL